MFSVRVEEVNIDEAREKRYLSDIFCKANVDRFREIQIKIWTSLNLDEVCDLSDEDEKWAKEYANTLSQAISGIQGRKIKIISGFNEPQRAGPA